MSFVPSTRTPDRCACCGMSFPAIDREGVCRCDTGSCRTCGEPPAQLVWDEEEGFSWRF